MKIKRNGFTLVEVIVVLVILGILLAVAVPNVIGYIGKANARACQAARINIERQGLALMGFSYETDAPLNYEAVLNGILAGEYTDYFSATDITCPGGGTYSITGGSVLCSKHTEGGSNTGEATVGVRENYNYADKLSYTTFVPGSSYEKGAVIEYERALILAVNNADSEDGAFNKNKWMFIGTTDGSAIDLTDTAKFQGTSTNMRFAPGVTVKTGADQLKIATSKNGLSSNTTLSAISESSAYVKPAAMSFNSSATLYSNSMYNLEKGSYYYNDYGLLFKYNGNSGSKNAITAQNINNGVWEPQTNVYLSNVNYKAGDTVWYNGYNYTANNDTAANPGDTSAWTVQQ